MIKNFLDADEDDSLIVKKSFQREAANEEELKEFAAPFARIEEEKDAPNDDLLADVEPETAAPNEAITSAAENETETEKPFESLPPEIRKSNEEKFWEGKLERLKSENLDQPNDFQTENFQSDDLQTFAESPDETVNFTLPFRDAPVNLESPVESATANFQPPAAESSEMNVGTRGETSGEKIKNDYPIFSNSPYHTETSDETIRKSGLAYAAAIILFGSIVFTLILGWFADLLLGTSPWGKVGGIILGAVIGFIQFFRTTSQILKNKD